MRDGLGLRYAFMGPMETIHLNALGLKKYCETYGETIFNVSKTMGEIPQSWLMGNDEDTEQEVHHDYAEDTTYSKEENQG